MYHQTEIFNTEIFSPDTMDSWDSLFQTVEWFLQKEGPWRHHKILISQDIQQNDKSKAFAENKCVVTLKTGQENDKVSAFIKVNPEIKPFFNILFSNSFLVTQDDKNVHAKPFLVP